jgi:endo-alpha-1,4-polygalactosaminidase (GH114 family)
LSIKQPRAEKPVGRAAPALVEVVVVVGAAAAEVVVVGTAAAEVVAIVVVEDVVADEVVDADMTEEEVAVLVVLAATVPINLAPKMLLLGLGAPMEFFM